MTFDIFSFRFIDIFQPIHRRDIFAAIMPSDVAPLRHATPSAMLLRFAIAAHTLSPLHYADALHAHLICRRIISFSSRHFASPPLMIIICFSRLRRCIRAIRHFAAIARPLCAAIDICPAPFYFYFLIFDDAHAAPLPILPPLITRCRMIMMSRRYYRYIDADAMLPRCGDTSVFHAPRFRFSSIRRYVLRY